MKDILSLINYYVDLYAHWKWSLVNFLLLNFLDSQLNKISSIFRTLKNPLTPTLIADI